VLVPSETILIKVTTELLTLVEIEVEFDNVETLSVLENNLYHRVENVAGE
jgi:hypothetical protein